MAKPVAFSKNKMSLQPDGSWKKGGDARSPQKTVAEVKALGKKKARKRVKKPKG